eukprot:657975-Pleurochrysis_carterae.AAC.3
MAWPKYVPLRCAARRMTARQIGARTLRQLVNLFALLTLERFMYSTEYSILTKRFHETMQKRSSRSGASERQCRSLLLGVTVTAPVTTPLFATLHMSR